MRFLLATFFSFALVGPVHSATVSDGGDAYMGCTATLSGALIPGDAEQVSAFFDAREDPFHILCLDSPGGSLTAGIQIGDILQERGISTAIARDAECLSACAVLFMAGLEWFNDEGPFAPHRQLHAAGRLGFHAPSLVVPKGQFDEEQVSRAYAIAIASLAEVSERKSQWQLADSLLTMLLKTPPSEIAEVDTVYEAALWGISVVGTVYPEEITILGAAEACTKSYAFRRETGRARLAEARIGPEFRHGRDPARIQTETGPAIRIYGYGDEGGQETCIVQSSQSPPGSAELRRAVGEYGDQHAFAVADWDGTDLQSLGPFMFFANNTHLRDIAAPVDGRLTRVPLADFTRPDIDTTRKGRCTVWRKQTLRDTDPCTETRLLTVSQDLVANDLRRYAWPSGAETVIDGPTYQPRVNGTQAQRLWDWDKPAEAKDATCWLNSGSGNTFCFETN